MTNRGTLAPMLILLVAVLSCSRFTGDNIKVTKPTQVVDFSAMAGRSLQELTNLLGQATPTESCFKWELSEGQLRVCYEIRDYAKKLMSSMSYQLNGPAGDEPGYGVASAAEMMQLINIDAGGREPEKHRKGFLTYNNFVMNDRSFFVDIHPRSTNRIFGSGDPVFTLAQMYIQNPHIYLSSLPDGKGKEVQFYEQQTNVDLTVKSMLIGNGHWELCTEPDFAGNCKTFDPISREYLDNSKNFSAFGLGERIRSLRPLPAKARKAPDS